uniref:Vitellinogen beta-sheet shell domain-containing protein n=1 Tax=Denticeps clupeoides TaxID=299321 RepID=A0AAY4E1K3_9TELE
MRRFSWVAFQWRWSSVGAWPGDAFVPATKLTAALAAQLLTPIKFEYANGVVGKVWAPAGVSATVLNVFRGILNIFHMNLKKTQNVYEMQEAGAQGVCKTHYVISEHAEGQHIAHKTSLRASRSSARSFEAKYLGENLDPVAVVILRAVKADKKIHGYQAAAYVDHAADRAQIIINALAEDNNWKMCADAVLLSKHKIMAKLAWGVECQEYAAIIKAESGALGPHPAARLKVQWVKIPGIFAHYGKRVADYIPGAAFMAGMRVHRADNDDKAIQVLMAVQAQRVLNIIVKTPKVKVSTMAHVNDNTLFSYTEKLNIHTYILSSD